MEGTDEYLDIVKAVQEGNYEFIQNTLIDRDRINISIVNTIDKDRCSLLHWAAINNRIEIANFLIEQGLSHALPGGILEETPLQWAIRKRYYKMMSLIYTKTHCNLHHKSAEGLDALHLCCELGDIYGAFLLLHWGVNPDSVNNVGDTPILSLLKNRSTTSKVSNQTKNELIKLLLRFGADATRSNEIDGNNSLHVMVTEQYIDPSIAFTIYHAAGPFAKDIKNYDDRTPYKIAALSNNRNFTNFFFHAMLYYGLPYHFPSAAMCCLVFIALRCVSYYGLIYGFFIGLVIAVIIAMTLLQLSIIDHIGRAVFGFFIGCFLSWVYTYYSLIAPLFNNYINAITSALLLTSVYSMYRFNRTKPNHVAKMENRATLAQIIIDSSPPEGTEEEASLQSRDVASYEDPLINPPPTVKFTKDMLTGELYRENLEVDRKNNHKSRGRTLGPRLCTLCLCDRRGVVKQYASSTSLKGFPFVNMILPGAVDAMSTVNKEKGNEVTEVISMASHCIQCDLCVIDQDHHFLLLNNCVGKGNRRMLWIFLLSFAFFLCSFFFTSKYVHHNYMCTETLFTSSWFLVNFISREWCALHRNPAFYILSCGSFLIGSYFIGLLQVQVVCVSRETTFLNVMRARYELIAPSYKYRIRSLLTFLFTGQYNVTYAKKSNRRKTVSDHNNENDGDHVDESTTLLDKDTLEYNRAMLLLKNIDQQLSNKNESETNVVNNKIEINNNSIRNSTIYDAPTNHNDNDNRDVPKKVASKGCNDKHCNNCENTAIESDYDEEYVYSDRNNYQDYYFYDSDNDKNGQQSNVQMYNSSLPPKNHTHSHDVHQKCSHSKHKHAHTTVISQKSNSSLIGIHADERV